MEKSIVKPIINLIIAGTIILSFSSCTWLSGADDTDLAAFNMGTRLYRGKIETSREDGDAHYKMGCNLQEKNKHRLAIEEFNRAVQIDPSNAAAYNGLGVSLDATEDYKKAVGAYASAIKIDPNLGYVFNNLGYSYLLQDRPDLAIAYFKQAVALDGTNQRYANNLGLAYARTGKYDEALATFKSVGDDADAHLKMGRFYYLNGFHKEAEIHFAWASILKPSDAGIRKAGEANAKLAKIHENDVNQPTMEKPLFSRIEKKQLPVSARDGFFTIPSGAIEDVEAIKIGNIEIASNDYPAINGVEPPMDLPEILPVSESAAEPAAPLKTAGLARLEKTDEEQVLKCLNISRADAETHTRSKVKIEVANGNGVRHMARDVGNFLSDRKVKLMYLSNADSFNHDETVIYYVDGCLDEAYDISQRLPEQQLFEQVPIIKGGNAEISVRIGKDLIAHLDLFREE